MLRAMLRPVIGIPLGLDESGRWKPGRDTLYLDAAYPRALEEAGATPLLLPVQGEPERLVAGLDGLLVPGGDDFEPPHPYPRHVRFHRVAPRQLAFDQDLLRAARAAQRPVLGLCYGMQLLALAHGGTLHYDLETDLPGAGAHRLEEPDARHRVRIEPGSRLARVFGDGLLSVNSRHHQAVAEPGAGLRVCARAEDGVVEAIEAGEGSFCLGVQWHPESLDAGHRRALFGAFATACVGG